MRERFLELFLQLPAYYSVRRSELLYSVIHKDIVAGNIDCEIIFGTITQFWELGVRLHTFL